MKIEEQVLSIEQMKHLKELGVDTSDASMAYYNISRNNQPDKWILGIANKEVATVMLSNGITEMEPTYTIGDLIEKLPEDLRFRCQGSNYSFSKNWDSLSFGYERIIPHSNNLIEGLFTLLCLAENHKDYLNKIKWQGI